MSNDMPRLKKLIDRVQSVMKRDKLTVMDVTKAIKYPYNQVHNWISTRKHQPGAEATLALEEFLKLHETEKPKKGKK